MRRLAAALILITLVLPYASAPLCAAATHEHPGHEGHHPMRALDAAEGAEAGGIGCHALMSCDLTVQAPLAIREAPPRVVPKRVEATEKRPRAPQAPPRAPHAPPPRPV